MIGYYINGSIQGRVALAYHRADCAPFRNDLRFSVRHHQHFDDPTYMKKNVDTNSDTFYSFQSKGIVNVRIKVC